jgi:hypothetical protein
MAIIINGRGRVGVRTSSGGGGSTPSYLLDTYGDAVYAYSLRKLSSTYTGNAIRVRRSSDNSEQDIGFDANGNLDTSSLLSFVGSGDGFISVWYDQSGPFVGYYLGHANFHQGTAVNQPQIVSSGTIITDNGKPSIMLDGVNDTMGINYDRGYTFTDATFVFVTSQLTGDSNYGRLLDYNYGDGFWFGRSGTSDTVGGGWAQPNSPYGVFQSVANDTQFLMFAYRVASTGQSNIAVNNSSFNSITTSTAALQTALTLGAWGWGQTGYGKKKVQEIILYPSNKSADRTGINTNINSFYSIY